MILQRFVPVYIVVCLVFSIFLSCQQDNKASITTENSDIYDETADAKQDIRLAVEKAADEGKHVLLMFGGNWCIWCHRLHRLFNENKTIHDFLQQKYILVMIDVGKRDKYLDLNEQYGNPYQHGFPVLVVLDNQGNQLTTQETGSLEKPTQEGVEKGHDPEKVLGFLQQWAPLVCADG